MRVEGAETVVISQAAACAQKGLGTVPRGAEWFLLL